MQSEFSFVAISRNRDLEVCFVQEIIAKLTAKDDKYACAIADKIISESQDSDKWYEYFDDSARWR